MSSSNEFFGKLLNIESATIELIVGEIRKLFGQVGVRDPVASQHRVSAGGVEINREIRVTSTDMVLAGVRAVAVGGFRMRSANPEDRVDLITVCRMEKRPEGWRVVGLQGQLQSAWLRIGPIVSQGTRSGTVALMGRNLSHNIGSHVLFWLEQDLRQAGSEPDKEELVRFLRYLRERMELLAGFATTLPLSPQVVDFRQLVEDFRRNTVLLRRLGRSERFSDVKIVVESPKNLQVSIPGGSIGIQAFYAILENIIRDRTKYGNDSQRTKHGNDPQIPQIRIRIESLPEARHKNYLKVTVTDDAANFGKPNVGGLLNQILDELRIAGEGGELLAGAWGVKERFIAAALLRGVRLESFEFVSEDHEYWSLGRRDPDKLRILDVQDCDGNLGWVFYLLRPEEVLVIAPETKFAAGEIDAAATRETFSWLEKNLEHASCIRHRFFVFVSDSLREIRYLYSRRHNLPARVFVDSSGNRMPEGCEAFVPLTTTKRTGELFSPEHLQDAWIRHLAGGREDSYILVINMQQVMITWGEDGPKIREVPAGADLRALYMDPRCVGLFSRHWSPAAPELTRSTPARSGICYEGFSGEYGGCAFFRGGTFQANSARKLFEAALTKVLIVDERLGASTNTALSGDEYAALDGVYREKDRFRWKGVVIKGEEYAGQLPDNDLLSEWIGESRYDFICIHRGILDKLERLRNLSFETVCANLQAHVPHVVVHSGRLTSSDLPDGVKFLPLSNVAAWIDRNYSKVQIVEELCLTRRT